MTIGECKGQHGNCDICDGIRCDPNVGWGGFHDHYAKKEFQSFEEQTEYYKQHPPETWEEEDER